MNRQRGLLMLVLFLLAYMGLAGRIAWFQLVRGEKLSREAVAMRSRAIVLKEYDRGEILDRNSLPLTDLKTTTALYCLPGLLKDNNQDFNSPMYASPKNQELSSKLAQILDKDKKDIEMTISQARHSGHGFVRLASDLNPQEQHSLNNSQLTGVIVAPELKRYQDNGFCVHLLGYVGGGNPPRGQAGLEKAYDQIFARSSKNQALTSVFDARGLAIQGLMFKVRQEQDNQSALGLTLDKRIQTIVEESMNKRVNKGAVVVMDVKSREILAMASRPAFNPYRVEDYINDNQGSLNNRALWRITRARFLKWQWPHLYWRRKWSALMIIFNVTASTGLMTKWLYPVGKRGGMAILLLKRLSHLPATQSLYKLRSSWGAKTFWIWLNGCT